MKFKEEQYQKIVEMFEEANDGYAMGLLNPSTVTSFQDKLYKEFGDVMYFIDDWKPIVAFANPLTRELAHDQYVEKEKKYVWSSKKADRDSNVLTLYIDEYGMVSTSYRKVYENNLRNENTLITESEIRAWGYNPEMFDKEEVE